MTAIFISHRSVDNAEAQALKDWLGEQGHEQLFLDFDPADGIPAGLDWEQRLYQELRRCQALLIVLTPAWLESKWCGNELAIAREKGKAVFVVRVEACPGPVIPAIQEVDLTRDRDAGLKKLARGLKEHGLDPRDAFDWKPGRPIYPGLAAFDVDDAAIFFGRSEESWQAVEALRRLRLQATGSPKLLLITGASGSGKSSLMRAGVLARLRKEPSWIAAPPFRRGADAVAALADALAWAFPADRRPSLVEITSRLSRPDEAVQLVTLARELRLAHDRPEATLVLALDQAEELLGAGSGDDAAKLLDLLQPTLAVVGHEILVIATIRSDRLGAWQQHPSIKAATDHGELPFAMLPLGPMPMARIGEIVRGPAAYEGLQIDDDLVDAIRADTVTPDALPLLAYTLQYLHRGLAGDGHITLAEYRSFGGLEGSVRSQADATIAIEKLSEEDRRALRDAFVPGLVRATADGGFSRSRALLATLPPRAEPYLRRLTDEARLLMTNRDPEGNDTLEVAHESLLRVWPTLDRWITKDAESLRRLESLQRAARDWADAGGGNDFLVHRDYRLSDAEILIAEPRFAARLDTTDRDYLAACRNAQNLRETEETEARERELRAAQDLAEEQKAKARRTLVGLVVASALAVLAAGLGWWGWDRAGEAQRQSAEATTQKEEAELQRDQALRAQSLRLADLSEQETARGNATNGILLALEALPKDMAKHDRPYVVEAETALYAAVINNRELVDLEGHTAAVTSAVFSPDGIRVVTASRDNTARLWDAASGTTLFTLEGHMGSLYSAAFSPDGTRVITASSDHTARLWDAASGMTLFTLEDHTGSVYSAAFSQDGTRVVTASEDNTARLWDAASGETLFVLQGHTAPVTSAAFSQDGTRVVTASEDNTARLWDAASGETLFILQGHTAPVRSAAFSRDGTRVVTTARYKGPRIRDWASGRLLATTSEDQSPRLWDSASGEPVFSLEGHTAVVNSAAFSQDGTRVVTASEDNTARLWDAASGETLFVLQGHTAPVTSAAFSQDGMRLVTVSEDNTARLWDAASGEPLFTLEGHTDWVESGAFSPDGTRLVTVSEDDTARLWEAASGTMLFTLKGHTAEVWSAVFSQDGTRVVTASDDNTARLWDAASGTPLFTLEGHTAEVGSAAFSPDGTRVVTASFDMTARLWDAASGTTLFTLEDHTGSVYSAAFSQDGTRVVTTSKDNTARLWDAASGTLLFTLKGHKRAVGPAAFSPDDTRVVTASGDNTARLWDAASGTPLFALEGHTAGVNSAAFSHDGTRVVTASFDNTARLWDAASGMQLTTLKGHTVDVRSAAFSPDGTRVVTASLDDTARLWDTASGEAIITLEGHTGPLYSAAFSPDGTRVITASSDHTARLWDAVSGALLITLKGHTGDVTFAAFSPDGTQVLTASEDNTARIWRVFPTTQALIDYARSVVPRPLTRDQHKQFFLE